MLYQLTWQAKTRTGWGKKHFVIGEIGPIHACYTAMIMTHTKPSTDTTMQGFRAVVTAVTAAGESPKNIVYEWGPGASSMTRSDADADQDNCHTDEK